MSNSAEIRRLATQSFQAYADAKMVQLKRRFQNAQSEVALNGATGHGGVIVHLGITDRAVRRFGRVAAASILDAATAVGQAYGSHLERDLQTIASDLLDPADKAIETYAADNLKPHIQNPTELKKNLDAQMASSGTVTRLRVRSEISHYVAGLRSKRSASFWNNILHGIYFLAGIVLTAIATGIPDYLRQHGASVCAQAIHMLPRVAGHA